VSPSGAMLDFKVQVFHITHR